MNLLNYQTAMEQQISTLPEGTPLLLHSCCGPCSSAVLERLAHHFALTLYYYNPNIWPDEEYKRRLAEQVSLLERLPLPRPVEFVEGAFEPARFAAAATGLENQPEGGLRCRACFALRLEEAAKEAARRGIEWYTTTLTVSPHKNAGLLNQAGEEMGERHGVRFLSSDFKKKNGYQRSLELSREYGLYRQQYCGCRFSAEARGRANPID